MMATKLKDGTTPSVAVVVPVYRTAFSAEEELSRRHLARFLGHYDTFLVVPERLPVDADGCSIQRFDDDFFTGTDTYSRLLLSRAFYEAFAAYEFILIYQLDCLVFADQLQQWCEAGYDYVGAPWFKSRTNPALGFSRVGNGGLSLRRVSSFLRLFDARRPHEAPLATARDVWRVPYDLRNLPPGRRLRKSLRVLRQLRRGVAWYTQHYTLNEDHFWSDRARLFDPAFRIAPVDVALGFAFERFPRYCFEQNERRLPFGCHAWAKWDRAFWEPHLLKEGAGPPQAAHALPHGPGASSS